MKQIIKTIKIGKKRLKNNLFLAPLLGFTNFAFRELVQKTAKISVFTEMIPINALSKDSNYGKYVIKRGDSEKNVFYQFFGNDEEKFVKSVDNILDSGIKIDFLNLNCGCPANDIISQGAGSALLKRESKIIQIIKRAKESFDIPFTIKIRTGFNIPKHLNYTKLEKIQLDAIFIHGRTKKQQYSGKIDLDYIKEAKEKTKIPIIANGDIKSLEDVELLHNKTNCDGYMIGRGAVENPFIFDEILNNKKHKFEEKINFLENYYKLLKEEGTRSEYINTKNLALFMIKGIEGAVKARVKISKAKTFKEIETIIKKLN